MTQVISRIRCDGATNPVGQPPVRRSPVALFAAGNNRVERRSTWTAEGGCPHVVCGGLL